MCESDCDLSYLDKFTKFLKETSNKMRYAVVLERVAQFFTRAVAELRCELRKCGCEYFSASDASWKNVLKELHRLTKYLRDNKFQDLEILYENPTVINDIEARAIFSTIMIMITNINIFSLDFLKFARDFDMFPEKHDLIKQYITLIKENMVTISERHRGIALEKYFVGTERSRVINRLSNSFSLF